ncbi:MAG TPA: hypothetical protein VJO52_09495 [Gemmatimonadaceae bacterium]|nr:hypothetical protein [Gemmatimonadaceae bacterium]
MTTHRVTGSGGVELHVAETGNARGRPILHFVGALTQLGTEAARAVLSPARPGIFPQLPATGATLDS